MKTKIIILVFICITKICQSQVDVGDGYFGHGSVGNLKDDDLERFKKTTTLFVVPNHEKDKLEEYRNAITPIWFFNPIDFITEDEVATYRKKPGEYSYFLVDIFYAPYKSGLFYNFGYHLPYLHKGKKERVLKIAYIKLDIVYTPHQVKTSNYKETDKELMELYNSCTVNNFTPAHMKCFLSFISSSLLSKTTHWIMQENYIIEEDKLWEKLSTDTLFIPSYVKNYILKGPKSSNIEVEKELMKDYKFNYKFLNPAEFESRIVNCTKPCFVFNYLLDQANFFSIISPNSGQMVYSNCIVKMKDNLNAKDFAKISKKIEKSIGK